MLIETCLESGFLTLDDIRENLAGKHAHQVSRAVVSILEHRIGAIRASAEEPGSPHRDELCGAARALVELRAEIVQYLNEEPQMPPEPPRIMPNTPGQTNASLPRRKSTRQ